MTGISRKLTAANRSPATTGGGLNRGPVAALLNLPAGGIMGRTRFLVMYMSLMKIVRQIPRRLRPAMV